MAPSVDKPEVSVEEMVAALRHAAEELCNNSPQLEEHVNAARDYILAAADETERIKAVAYASLQLEITKNATIAELRREIAAMRRVTGPPCPKCGHWLKAEHYRRELPVIDGRITDLPVYVRTSHKTAVTDDTQFCITVAELLALDPSAAAEMGLTLIDSPCAKCGHPLRAEHVETETSSGECGLSCSICAEKVTDCCTIIDTGLEGGVSATVDALSNPDAYLENGGGE